MWSVDGNIEYGSGKHLILVVFSCGVLVIGLAYPVLVLCAPLLERYSHKCILHRWNLVANQATVGCLWRTLQRQVSILDRIDSDGATDCEQKVCIRKFI